MTMTIEREDVDRREVDFTDVASGRWLPSMHPGEILRDELLTPMDLSVRVPACPEDQGFRARG